MCLWGSFTPLVPRAGGAPEQLGCSGTLASLAVLPASHPRFLVFFVLSEVNTSL